MNSFDTSAYLPPLPPERKPILYHYTTRESLLGIIESRELWTSNVRHLNDSREISTATEIAHSVIDSFISSELEPNEKQALTEFRSWLTSLNEQMQSYVFSLSEESDLLSQWRGYTKPGNGYAIGFQTNALIELCATSGVNLQPCRYIESEQQGLIKEIFMDGLKFLRAQSKVVGSDPVKQQFIGRCTFAFLHVAPLIKDKSFSEEKEWRLVAPFDAHLSPNMSFRAGKSMIIPYIPFTLGKIDLPIVDVVIGPSPYGILDSVTVLDLLRHAGAIGKSCRFSAIPYRDW